MTTLKATDLITVTPVGATGAPSPITEQVTAQDIANLGTQASFPLMAEPPTNTIPAGTWVSYTDSTTHRPMLKYSDGTKDILVPYP